ncbi:type II CAAX endopeptidase family protein [Lysinibacter sp. HNR]|uniref:CPBP family intramembrane glutamic endopeptidase n=1 Tax=Lysinibacter sp. HNR TaxID=3031408 RepID=UPI00243522E9|nr:type II CAAX endopeptidase family protein [Lysinibacter sp. HNR]WGD37647.1 type II CAAX endopeptidase family protein [Lysinibacter sp. HNR]
MPYAEQAVSALPTPRLEYQRLFRGQKNYRWWKPLLAVVLSALFIGVAMSMLLVAVAVFDLIFAASTGRPGYFVSLDGTMNQEAFTRTDAANPLSLLINLATIALWIPCVLLALWVSGIRPVGRVHSVAMRLRWRWMGACVLPALGATALMMAIGTIVAPLIIDEAQPEPLPLPGTFAIVVLIIIVVVPLQAAAEEYVFRGLLTQVLGAWIKFRVVALVVPTLIFASLHSYDVWGILNVAIFGITAAWITLRTGGLEAAIVLHTMNNVVLFLLLATGASGDTRVATETAGPVILIGTSAMMALYAWWVDRKRQKVGLETTGAYDTVVPGAAPSHG